MSSLFVTLLLVLAMVGPCVFGAVTPDSRSEEEGYGPPEKNNPWEENLEVTEEDGYMAKLDFKELDRFGALLRRSTQNWKNSDKDELDDMLDLAMKGCAADEEESGRSKRGAGCSVKCKKSSCECDNCSKCYCTWWGRRAKCVA